MRRVGVLAPWRGRPGSAGPRGGIPAGLQQLGWTIGRNVQIDYRWAGSDADKYPQTCGGIGRACAGRHPCQAELGHGAVAAGDPHACRSCLLTVADPVGAGFVEAWRGRAAMPPGSLHSRYGISGQMAGTAQRDRAERDASGGTS